MKKALIIFTVLLQVVGLIITSSAVGGPHITISSTEAGPGETVTIDITIFGYDGITAFQMTPDYDTAKLSLEKVEKNTSFPGLLNYGSNITWVNLEKSDYFGTAFTLTFRVLDSVEKGTTNISFTDCSFKDQDEKDVEVSISPGTITVKSKGHIHTWDAGKVTKAATCKEAGEKTFTCTVCKETKTETISKDASNHADYGTEVKNAKAATETAKGYTGDTVCKGCGAVLKKGEDIAPLGHKHTLTKTEAKAAACTAAGNVEYYTCSGCKKTFSDAAGTKEITNVTVPAKGHTFGAWKVEKAATKTEEGLESRTCSVCEYKETRKIAKLTEPSTGVILDIGPNNNGYDFVSGNKPTEKAKDGKTCPATEKADSKTDTAKTGAKVIKTDAGKNTGDNGILLVVTGFVALAGAAFVVTKKRRS